MNWQSILSSSIGRKVVMAVSGLALFGFVIIHMLGNLLIFAGPAALNGYAEKLESLGEILWVARIGLMVMVVLHIWSGLCLARENRQARPLGYLGKKNTRTTFAATTMAISGLLVLAYIIFHLLHFTFRVTHPQISHLLDADGRRDVYTLVVLSFHELPIALAYFVSMILLSLHLSHGFSSALQTLGIANESSLHGYEKMGRLIAAVIFLGYSSIPTACWLGIIKASH
ncbi:MAG: succinate dehydrogenase cytochrome b subunit [Candidatus Omnitrophica bacterium]|nr:succinate dehydrogenase cytochrome b subunit [Candidatus Omnitrophota bacterium]